MFYSKMFFFQIALQSCFQLDPNERLSCQELLEHPYFAEQRRAAEIERSQEDQHIRRDRDRKRDRIERTEHEKLASRMMVGGAEKCFIFQIDRWIGQLLLIH